MRKRVFILMTALVMAFGISACGAKEEAAVEAPMMMANGSMTNDMAGEVGQAVPGTEQKLIKTIRMEAETEDLDALLPQINAKISALGGYVENQELYNGSSYSSYRHRNASLTIRIPADRLASFTEDVKGVSNVVSYNENTENVTLRYVSTESRMQALEVEQARLLELLAKAENMSDLLEIEARLTDVRYELESVTSQLRVLANQVDYATVHLYISQVKVYTETEEQTVWQRIGSGFKENLKNLGENLTDFFVWVVTYSPQLLFWAIVIAIAVTVLKKKLAGRKAKKDGQ